MNENTANKRKTGIFISAAVLINIAVKFLANFISSSFLSDSFIEASDDLENLAMNRLIADLPSYIASVISLIIFLVMGYLFTGNKKKTIIFTGALYFGESAVSILSSLIDKISKIAINYNFASTSSVTSFLVILPVILSPLVIFLAYLAFTGFEGINTKLNSQSLENSQMTLSRARKRYLAYSIIGGLAVAAVNSGILYLIDYFALSNYNPADPDSYISFDFTISASAISWLSSLAILVIIYVAGYKPFKSHTDAMAFVGVDKLALMLVSVVSKLVYIIYSFIVNKVFIEADNIGYAYSLTTSIYGSVSSILATIATFIVALLLFRYFFQEAKITLFTETPEIPIESEEAEEISLDAE